MGRTYAKVRKPYNEKTIELAIEEVIKGASVKATAKKHLMSTSMLRQRVIKFKAQELVTDYRLPSTSSEGQPPEQFAGSCKSLKYTPADDEADMVMEVSAGDLGLPLAEAASTPSSVASATRSKKSLNLSIEVQEDNPEEILGLEHLILELPDQQLLESSSKDNFDKENEAQNQIRQVEDQNEDTNESDDDEDVVEEDEDEADDDYDDSAASDEEDEDAGGGISTITALSANQAELVDRLMNDSISFSELTAMMGDGGEGDLLPADDVAASTDAAITAAEAPEAVEEKPRDAGSTAEREKSPNMDSAEQFEQELCQQQRSRRRGRGRGQRVHPIILALMGQANICMANDDTNEAIKMCLEVIRQFPTSPLPYETLALIYENRGLKNKFLQFQLMAAFLSPVAEKWVDLAEYYENQDELDQAVYCYSRAIRLSPSELPLHWSRVELLERMGQQARALNCYSYMIKFLKPDQAEAGLKLAKDIAKIHFSLQNYGGARKVLEAALLRYPSHVTHEDINLLLDVLLTMKDYSAGLGALIAYAGVSLLPKEDFPESEFSALAVCDQLPQSRVCHMPADLPIDLRSKLTVCLVMTRTFSVAQPLLHALMLEPTEQFGDLYLDAAEALLSAEAPTRALPLLRRMLDCPHHRTSAVAWRLYAEALVAEGGPTEEAVQAYYRVVEYAPDNASARLTLADLLQSRGSNDEALIAMGQDLRSPYDCQVLQRKCELLLERGMLDEFVSTVTLLLGRHFVNIRSRDEAEVLINNKKASNKFEALRELRRSKSEPVEDSEAQYCGAEVPLLHQWRLFVRACRILFSQKRYAELEHLTYGALGCREFMKEHIREVEFFCLQASMVNNNSYFAFNLVRDIVVRYPDNCRVWNLLNQVIIRADDFRHNRFLLRLSQKQPNNLALSMLNAHNCLVAGTYKYSLAEYMKVFKGRQTDPLASLMLGLTYVHMACQKFSADKNTLVTQAWVFLNSYRELRGDCQESMYNIGRAMHQLNVLHQAIHYYELALQCPRPVQRPGEPSFDLTCEIAFNLSLLYRKGSPKLSRYYIRKYITV